MGSQRYIAVVLGIVALVFIIALLLNFSIASFSVLEQSVNLTDSPYQEQINLTISTTKTSFSLLQFAPLLLALALVIFSLFALIIIIKRKGNW